MAQDPDATWLEAAAAAQDPDADAQLGRGFSSPDLAANDQRALVAAQRSPSASVSESLPKRALSDMGPVDGSNVAGLSGVNIAALMRATKKFRGKAELNRQKKRLPKLTAHYVLRRQYRSYKQVIAAKDDSLSPDIDEMDEANDDDHEYGDNAMRDTYNQVRGR